MRNWIAKFNLEVLTFVAVTFIVCVACFMQSRLTKLVNIPYREFPKIMRGRVLALVKDQD